MRIDAFNYSEQNTPANSTVPAEGGQRAVTQQELAMDRGLSPFGLATTPYPLWDGSDRILVAWRPCEVTRDGVLIPCANLTEAERTRWPATARGPKPRPTRCRTTRPRPTASTCSTPSCRPG
jgi:hypothetical protein